jgi:hypothetical protein
MPGMVIPIYLVAALHACRERVTFAVSAQLPLD